MTDKQHGELVRHGDEFNREPWYQCGQCGSVHGRQLPECDGLRKPFRRAVAMTDPKMPEPAAWTLQSELDAKQSTCRAHLWFSDPMNTSWAPLITTEAAQAYAEALAEARVAQRRCVPDVDELAQHIRWLGGSHKMGAGRLAEKLVDYMRKRAQPSDTGKEG